MEQPKGKKLEVTVYLAGDFDGFLDGLKEGKSAPMYLGYACECKQGYKKSQELQQLLETSTSKAVGFYKCYEKEGERAEKSGKIFMQPSASDAL